VHVVVRLVSTPRSGAARKIVCRDEIVMGITTYKAAKGPDAHKEDRAIKRRRKDVLHAKT